MKQPIDFLISKTPRSRQDKARNEVRIDGTAKKVDRLRGTKSLVFKISTHKSLKPHRYVCTVEYDGDKAIRSKNISVGCTCADHCFTWEYALTKAGYSKIKYSNGDKPYERNPRMIPGVCGHMFRCLVLIKRRNM